MGRERISVLVSDDTLIVREGVKALLEREPDLEVVGMASDLEELIAAAEQLAPQVLVTDIRMPPTFQHEGIDAANEVRKRHPGTGVVILSQYEEPEYAISLLGRGSAGWAYLLKDHLAEGDHLVQAVRRVATGGSMLDPGIVEAIESPVLADAAELTQVEHELLHLIAQGRPIRAIAASRRTTPAAVDHDVERLFLKLARGASDGTRESLHCLRLLHQAIVEREEQGETLSRFLPGGIAEKLRREGSRVGTSERLEVTVLMSDVRDYSEIAERTDPAELAAQLQEHREEMSRAILDSDGTVMQFVGDGVLAVFGAPEPQDDHAGRAVDAAVAMHRRQAAVDEGWKARGLPPFHLGIGLSTGPVAAALLGSEDRLEYSIVGDTVNLAQRLQQRAGPGETVLSEPTADDLRARVTLSRLEPEPVKGRSAPVVAYRVEVVS
jgi:adenylate cyclase